VCKAFRLFLTCAFVRARDIAKGHTDVPSSPTDSTVFVCVCVRLCASVCVRKHVFPSAGLVLVITCGYV